MQPKQPEPTAQAAKDGLSALTVGSIGVVFGDIGTSPLYAMREALAHSSGAAEPAVLGVVSSCGPTTRVRAERSP